MKTAEEKAKEFCNRFTGMDKGMVDHIKLLLKEQDRDTRHACADAVMACEGLETPNRVRKDEAAGACINAKAV